MEAKKMELFKEIKKIVCGYCINKGMCAEDVQCNEIESLVNLFIKKKDKKKK